MGGAGRAHELLERSAAPPLSRAEEAVLARRYGEAGDRRAAHRLLEAHLRFIYRVAHSPEGYGLPFEDLVQEGGIGLLEAARRFDPAHGCRLLSYAVHWIRAQMIQSALRHGLADRAQIA